MSFEIDRGEELGMVRTAPRVPLLPMSREIELSIANMLSMQICMARNFDLPNVSPHLRNLAKCSGASSIGNGRLTNVTVS